MSDDDRRLPRDVAHELLQDVKRRDFLKATGAVAAVTAVAAGQLGQDGGQGNLTGGAAMLEEAYQIADGLWIGPDAAKDSVDAQEGRKYEAVDTEDEYWGDGTDWQSFDTSGKSPTFDEVVTERAEIDVTASRSNLYVDNNAQDLLSRQGFAVSTFHDLNDWTVLSSDTTLDAETDDPYRGTQSATITVTDANTTGEIELELDNPIDIYDVSSISMAFKSDGGQGTRVWVRFIDGDQSGDPYIRFRMGVSSSRPVDYWHRFDATVITDKDHDGSNVTKVMLEFEDTNTSGATSPLNVSFDDLRAVRDDKNRGGFLLWIENAHGDNDDYTLLDSDVPFIDVLGDYSVPVAINTRPGQIVDHDGLDLMRRAQAEGHEIVPRPEDPDSNGSGSINFGEGEVTEAEAREAMEHTKSWFIENGFHSGVDHLVYLQNDVGSEAMEAVGGYVLFARSGGSQDHHGWHPTAAHSLNSQGLDSNTVDRVKSLVDEAIEHGWVANAYWHNRNVSEDDAREALAYIEQHIKSGELEAITPSELWEMQDVRGARTINRPTVERVIDSGEAFVQSPFGILDDPSTVTSTSFETVANAYGVIDMTRVPDHATPYGRFFIRADADDTETATYRFTVQESESGTTTTALEDLEVEIQGPGFTTVDTGYVELTDISGEDMATFIELEGMVTGGDSDISGHRVGGVIEWRID